MRTVTIADRQFTGPEGRQLLPAPEAYWWQAVLEIDTAVVCEGGDQPVPSALDM